MTTPGEEAIRRRYEDEERKRVEYERSRLNLTVRKAVITKAVCSRCNHSWPYMDGDENRPCPACGGGTGRSWP